MKGHYFLGIDVGNTHTVIGLFTRKEMVGSWRISTQTKATCHELAPLLDFWLSKAGISFNNIRGAIIASVVPPVAKIWQELSKQYLDTSIFDAHEVATKLIKISYPRPHEIGTDRLINSIAAFSRLGGPVIVVDFGTATTFDCISKDGTYLGGAIAPGISMSIDSLFSKTSKLPLVQIDQANLTPIGKSTEEAIRSGILFGFAGLTDRIIEVLSSNYESRPQTVATGGLAKVVFDLSERLHHLIPELTMEGLRICMMQTI